MSRATAYRYFPSQAALVQTVVDEGLGPILTWRSRSRDPRRRVEELLDTAMPRVEAFEATFKAALKLSLDQWARRQAGTLGSEAQFTRGHRIALLKDAIPPLQSSLPAARLRTACPGVVAGVRRRSADRAEGHLGPRRRRDAVGGAVGGERACRGRDRKGRRKLNRRACSVDARLGTIWFDQIIGKIASERRRFCSKFQAVSPWMKPRNKMKNISRKFAASGLRASPRKRLTELGDW